MVFNAINVIDYLKYRSLARIASLEPENLFKMDEPCDG
jgi:hypothetical protein